MSTGAQLWDGTKADLVICASGAMNALGFNPYQTWAFWRAEAVGLAPCTTCRPDLHPLARSGGAN